MPTSDLVLGPGFSRLYSTNTGIYIVGLLSVDSEHLYIVLIDIY